MIEYKRKLLIYGSIEMDVKIERSDWRRKAGIGPKTTLLIDKSRESEYLKRKICNNIKDILKDRMSEDKLILFEKTFYSVTKEYWFKWREEDMSKEYKLGDFNVLSGNSFSYGDVDLIYFSIDKENDSIRKIVDKLDFMINNVIHQYERKHKCNLDVKQLEMNAGLMISFANKERRPESSIDITISSCKTDDKEVLLENEYIVLPGTEIYKEFKRYFMEQLEAVLFEERS